MKDMRVVLLLFVAFLSVQCSFQFGPGEDTVIGNKKNITCAECDTVIGDIEDLIQGNASIKQIVKYVQDYCDYIPMRDACRKLVGDYTTKFVKLVIAEESPEDICESIKICNRSHPIVPFVGNSTECELCQWLLSQLAGAVDNKATEHEILAAVISVCALLPEKQHASCKELINGYGDQVIDLVLNDATPTVACVELDLCGKGVVS